MGLNTYQVTISGRVFSLKMKKDTARGMAGLLKKAANLESYRRELSGTIGGQEYNMDMMALVGPMVSMPPEYRAAAEAFIAGLPGMIDAGNAVAVADKLRAFIDQHIIIQDNRKTAEDRAAEDAQSEADDREREAKREAVDLERGALVGLSGNGEKATVKSGQRFVTISAAFDDSESQSDYYSPQAPASGEYALAVIPDGPRREDIARRIIAAAGLDTLSWTWHAENWSMGRGYYLTSPVIGQIEKKAYDGRDRVDYWYSIRFDGGRYGAREMLKSRYFTDGRGPVSGGGGNAEPIKAGDGVTVTKNAEKNGVELRFIEKPGPDVLADLKARGWRWSFANRLWYHRDTPDAEAYALALAG